MPSHHSLVNGIFPHSENARLMSLKRVEKSENSEARTTKSKNFSLCNCDASSLDLLKVCYYKLRRKSRDVFNDPILSQLVVTTGHTTYTDIFRYFSVEAETTTQYTTLCWPLCIQ
jgi:hypothetical protein